MILSFALAIGLQTSPPPLPPSVRSEFAAVCLRVEKDLATSDFAAATEDAKRLPHKTFVLGWDDHGAPEALRPGLERIRDFAINAWHRVKGYDVKIATTGDVNIRFERVLPPIPSGIPAGAQLSLRDYPKVDLVVGLYRGKPLEPIIAGDAYPSMVRAIGAYLGVADNPLFGSAMFPDDRPSTLVYGPTPGDLVAAGRNMLLVDALQKAVTSKTTLKAQAPQVELSPKSYDLGSVIQGKRIPISFTVHNAGDARLEYQLTPDCGCFSNVPPGGVEAGKTTVLTTVVNTAQYVGQIHKMLVLYSNDGSRSAIQIPVDFRAVPAFRFYRPEGDILVMNQAPATTSVLLTLPAGSKIQPVQYQFDGFKARVTMMPWQGIATDPELGEGPMARKGYKFQIKVLGPLSSGRSVGTLSVTTDDPDFPIIRYTLSVQKGIIAMPESVFLGEMTARKRNSFLVSRPGKPFLIEAVKCDSPNIKAICVPLAGGTEYRVDVYYDGGATPGDFLSVVRVHTNDKAQPEIDVTVTGVVS